ncbi:MAG: hypothetical protein RL199_184 [Pseudomonadota bacterium]|jgi:hypothetical protein
MVMGRAVASFSPKTLSEQRAQPVRSRRAATTVPQAPRSLTAAPRRRRESLDSRTNQPVRRRRDDSVQKPLVVVVANDAQAPLAREPLEA